jgi:hypothetical protein
MSSACDQCQANAAWWGGHQIRVYLGRGVDGVHFPLLNSPERASVRVKFIIGENDPGYVKCSKNWQETRAKLIRSGHVASKLEMEVIKKGNAAGLGIGHQWYPTRPLDFCDINDRHEQRRFLMTAWIRGTLVILSIGLAVCQEGVKSAGS